MLRHAELINEVRHENQLAAPRVDTVRTIFVLLSPAEPVSSPKLIVGELPNFVRGAPESPIARRDVRNGIAEIDHMLRPDAKLA